MSEVYLDLTGIRFQRILANSCVVPVFVFVVAADGDGGGSVCVSYVLPK